MMILPSVAMLSGAKLELAIDLDRNAVRKLGHADGGAGMLTDVRPEQLVEEIGGTIDHLRHAVEAGRRIDHAEQPDHAA